jgi:hypothetical protein
MQRDDLLPFLHYTRDMVIRDQAGTMLQGTSLKDERSRGDNVCSSNGMCDHDLKQQLCLGSKMAFKKTFRWMLQSEQLSFPSGCRKRVTGGVVPSEMKEETAHRVRAED